MSGASIRGQITSNWRRRALLRKPGLHRHKSTSMKDNDAVIVSFARTPVGKFQGSLQALTAPQLGAVATKEAVSRAGLKPEDVQEVILGNVVSAGIGQAPARQAAIAAGLPQKTVTWTVNKVCASGMKSVILGAQQIQLGVRDVVLTGGFESMSNVPYYLLKARQGYRMGNDQLIDGVVHDGLWDPYDNVHMGMCAEKCASDHRFSREEQDAYAVESYTRAKAAVEGGRFQDEIVPVTVSSKKGSTVVSSDEQYLGINPSKVPSLRPAFKRDGGTVTAGNSSSLNDGAAALVVMSAKEARARGIKPLARILGYGDAEQAPVDFTTAPSKAVPVALKHAGLSLSDVHVHEINEAFAVVVLANQRLLDIDSARLNVNGGAVALGHPIGMSGARITGTLITALRQVDGTIGVASVCNGGGGASAIVLERMQ